MVTRIRYIGDLIGYDHVGIGSDFNGVPFTIPGLEDVSKFPDLVAAMLRQGISYSNVQKIVGGGVCSGCGSWWMKWPGKWRQEGRCLSRMICHQYPIRGSNVKGFSTAVPLGTRICAEVRLLYYGKRALVLVGHRGLPGGVKGVLREVP